MRSKNVVLEYRSGMLAREWLSGHPTSLPPDVIHNGVLRGASNLITTQGNAYRNLGKSSGRIGGDFHVMHRQKAFDNLTPQVYMTDEAVGGGSITRRFNGKLACVDANVGTGLVHGWPTPVASPTAELDAFGASAIAMVEPTAPLAGLSVALAEIKREGIPKLLGASTWRSRTNLARSAGKEYLNQQFGWVPLVNDIRDAVNSARNSEKIIAQYDRDSGRRVKRQFHGPTEVSVSTEEGTGSLYLSPAPHSSYLVTAPKWSRTETIEKTLWFEGCFSYYIPPFDPDGSNAERTRRLAHKLYGASITPETIWNLTPWSWAVDWMGNFGDVFHNIGAFLDNGLVMHYGYVMETTRHRIETRVWDIRSKRSESTKYQPDSLTPRRISTSAALETITKQRVTATPYGFGLNIEGFTPFQLSILVALGISKG